MRRTSTQEKYSIETMARPSRNSYTAYALKNYSQKDMLSVQVAMAIASTDLRAPYGEKDITAFDGTNIIFL